MLRLKVFFPFSAQLKGSIHTKYRWNPSRYRASVHKNTVFILPRFKIQYKSPLWYRWAEWNIVFNSVLICFFFKIYCTFWIIPPLFFSLNGNRLWDRQETWRLRGVNNAIQGSKFGWLTGEFAVKWPPESLILITINNPEDNNKYKFIFTVKTDDTHPPPPAFPVSIIVAKTTGSFVISSELQPTTQDRLWGHSYVT